MPGGAGFTPARSYSNPGDYPIGIANPQDYTVGMRLDALTVRERLGRTRGLQPYLCMACLMAMPVLIDTAVADSFRCGRKVVRTGDSPGELLQRCGEPRYKDRGYEAVRVQGRQKKVRVERWYYKKSARRIERIVVIHKGRIVAIDNGQR